MKAGLNSGDPSVVLYRPSEKLKTKVEKKNERDEFPPNTGSRVPCGLSPGEAGFPQPVSAQVCLRVSFGTRERVKVVRYTSCGCVSAGSTSDQPITANAPVT